MYYFLLIFFFAGLTTRTGYEILKNTGRVNTENRLVIILIFTAMTLMWVGWFGLCEQDPLKMILPDIISWLGFGLFFLGLILVVLTVIQLRGVENTDHFVTSGLFSKLRHPMYTGFMLWIPGWALYNGSLTSFLPGILLIVNIIYWIRLEEKELLKKYGDNYRDWQRQTWF